MALMTRIKGNKTILKSVRLEQSESQHEMMKKLQEKREQERREIKQVTLAMNERIQSQQQEEQLNKVLESFQATSLNFAPQCPDLANLP